MPSHPTISALTCPDIGLRLSNPYEHLPTCLSASSRPTPVSAPKVVMLNEALASDLGLTLGPANQQDLAELFSGNAHPDAAQPLALAYSGHQFGHFTTLGDGRAHYLGRHTLPNQQQVDIQLKGSGRSPYSRRGDGRAALGPMLREYLISEAMHALGIPTTRSLAVVTTGETVYRETALSGAVLTRVAKSHLRIGTFEYLATQQNLQALKQLADYTLSVHNPELVGTPDRYAGLLKAVMTRQIECVVHWQRVGFVHGVMNTDNMSLSGETLDYGPCAFVDEYHPDKVFSSIDRHRRYAFGQQPAIAQWNLARFAESILPLLHDDQPQALATATEIIESYSEQFQRAWLTMMRQKLGLFGSSSDDQSLCDDLLHWMMKHQQDYTATFQTLCQDGLPDEPVYSSSEFSHWWQRWQARLKHNTQPWPNAQALMRSVNPWVTPRNHQVEAALAEVIEKDDYSKLIRLQQCLQTPYQASDDFMDLCEPPLAHQRVRETFCGT